MKTKSIFNVLWLLPEAWGPRVCQLPSELCDHSCSVGIISCKTPLIPYLGNLYWVLCCIEVIYAKPLKSVPFAVVNKMSLVSTNIRKCFNRLYAMMLPHKDVNFLPKNTRLMSLLFSTLCCHISYLSEYLMWRWIRYQLYFWSPAFMTLDF